MSEERIRDKGMCPECKTTWDRWTDEKVDELPKGY